MVLCVHHVFRVIQSYQWTFFYTHLTVINHHRNITQVSSSTELFSLF